MRQSHWLKKIEPYTSQCFVHTVRETQKCEQSIEIYKVLYVSFTALRSTQRSLYETGLKEKIRNSKAMAKMCF